MSERAGRDGPSLGRRLVKIGGRLLVVLALVFLAREVMRHWSGLSAWRPEPWQIAAVATLALFYGLSIFVLAENWHRIVGLFGDEPRRRTWRSYTMTQIAKYVPGNVAHLLGRAVYLRGGALGDRQLGIATAIEIAVMPVGAGLFVLLACLVVPVADLVPRAAPLQPFLAPLAAALAVAVAAAMFLPRRAPVRAAARSLAGTALIALGFMSLLGLCFALTLNSVVPAPALLAAVVAVLGWIVGYATPGAPGGLGTREALMLFLLDGTVPEAQALVAIALFRLVTVLGDVICFGAGWFLFRRDAVREGAPD